MNISIPDPRPKYPEHLAVSAPLGTRDSVRRAAESSGMTVAAFIRAAIVDKLRPVETLQERAGA